MGRDLPAGPPERTLAEVVRSFLSAPHGYTRRTLQTHRERLAGVGRALRDLGASLPSEVTPETIDRWITTRSAVVSRATINRDLRSLRVCLRWAAERGLCAPVAAVAGRQALREPVRDGPRVVPSPEEVARILDAARPHHRHALAVLAGTGLRVEELPRLAVGDLRDGRLWVRPEAGPADTAEPGKGYRTRAIPCGPEVAAEVTALLAWRTAHPRRGGLSKSRLTRAYRAACARAGVPRERGGGLHDLRRAFATASVRAGVPLTVVRDWLGHRLVATTERYVGRYRTDGDWTPPVPLALQPAPPAAAPERLRSVRKPVVMQGPPGSTDTDRAKPRRR